MRFLFYLGKEKIEILFTKIIIGIKSNQIKLNQIKMKNICYVCLEKVKNNCVTTGCRCNSKLHQSCFETLLNKKGDVCSVCKGNFMLSQVPIESSIIFENDTDFVSTTTKRSRKDKNELPEGCVFIDEYVSLVDNYEDEKGDIQYGFEYLDSIFGIEFDEFDFTESGRPYCKRKTFEKFCRILKKTQK